MSGADRSSVEETVWTVLEKNGFIVPKYLINVLKMIGFDSVKTFALLSGTDLDLVYSKIDEKVRSTANSNDSLVSSLVFTNDFMALQQSGTTFKLPFGHKILLKAIRDYCVKLVKEDKH